MFTKILLQQHDGCYFFIVPLWNAQQSWNFKNACT